MLRPGSRLTEAAKVRCAPVPIESVDGVIAIEPAEVTVTCAVAITRASPTAFTRMMVLPGATPVTMPCVFTDATAGLSESHRRSSNAPASASTVTFSGS